MEIAIKYTFVATLLIEVEAILPVHSRVIIGYGNDFPAELFWKFICLLDRSLCFGNIRVSVSLTGKPATTTLGECVFPATLNHT